MKDEINNFIIFIYAIFSSKNNPNYSLPDCTFITAIYDPKLAKLAYQHASNSILARHYTITNRYAREEYFRNASRRNRGGFKKSDATFYRFAEQN